MEAEKLELFGSYDNIFKFFDKNTIDECVDCICEKYENVHHFAQERAYNIEYGCSCETINDFCNACYKISVYQEVCRCKNTKAEDLPNEMRVIYDAIITECNKRQINMNSFMM